MSASIATAALLIFAVCAAAPAADSGDGGESGAEGGGGPTETRVRASRPADIDDSRVAVADATLTPSPEDAVSAAQGASLVHDGGPLAPARLLVRGLSGARLDTDLGGLPLTDPATGLLDLASVPWAAVDDLIVESGATGGSAGALRLVPAALSPGLRVRVLGGDLGTVRASARVADGARALAVDAAITRGDFVFAPSSSVDAPAAAPRVRLNNDQRRVSAFGTARGQLGGATARVLAYGAAHEGGIPGLATRPTDGLRGSDGALGARMALERRHAAGRLTVTVDGRAAHRATWGPASARAALESLATQLGVEAAEVPLGPAAVTIGASSGVTALVDGRFTRVHTGARLGARAPLGPMRLAANGDVRLFSDVGALTGASLRVEAGETLRLSAGLARAARAPTLDELYAPRGIVLGNPALRPEIFNDLEVALAWLPGRQLEARVVAFAGAIEEGIAWVNRNAYEVAPVNLGRGWRAGVETSVTIEPSPVLGLDAVASLLWSRLETTGEALPLAPPFTSRLAMRLGPRDGGHLSAVVRARGAAPSNLYGTLVAAPYTLLDLLARLPLGPRLELGVAVSNIFDVLDAREANQLPLPGRLVFLSLEVHA